MALSENLLSKLDRLRDRHEELARLLADAEVVADRERYPVLSREYSELEPVIVEYERYRRTDADLSEANRLLSETDPEMRELATETIAELAPVVESQVSRLQRLLLPEDPNDTANVFVEIRAGTGGEEAGLFVGDLRRMYTSYALSKGWQLAILSESTTGVGGFKHVTMKIEGKECYGLLKFESGTHRVQRVPKTESQGRIHTSACTVAVLAENTEVTEVNVDKTDLRIDTFRASGAGGQHVNKTDSAVRITHIPSGTVVECQEERSQHRNREMAMAHLMAKLLQDEQAKRDAAEAQERKDLVGSGDRSERIRTYNFPQGRVTDHRINLTLYKLEEILEGALDQVIEPLVLDFQADQLRALQGIA